MKSKGLKQLGTALSKASVASEAQRREIEYGDITLAKKNAQEALKKRGVYWTGPLNQKSRNQLINIVNALYTDNKIMRGLLEEKA